MDKTLAIVHLITTAVGLLGSIGLGFVTYFKVNLMWKDYCKRHNINGNGKE